jgi:hypothetical protein
MPQFRYGLPQGDANRRWRVPPAIPSAPGDEVMEGLNVLDELPGEPGLVLWQALRDVLLWAGASPEARSGLFPAAAETARVAAMLAAPVPRELEPALMTLARLGARGLLEEPVALACREISQWLDERGLLASALAFAHAAASVAVGDAGAAFAVGRLARRRAENARAEAWFNRSVTLARQAGDWGTCVRAYMGLGVLHVQRGALPAARRARLRALRAARTGATPDYAALVLHDLFLLAVEMGDCARADEFAAAAYAAYSSTHARIPVLAHDVAYYWTTQGGFAHALPVLEGVLPRLPGERLCVLSVLARAAGGAGRRDRFDSAWDAVWSEIGNDAAGEKTAAVLLDLAHGAVSLKDWVRAEVAASQALALATARGEARVRLTAEALLDCAVHHRGVEARTQAARAAASDRAAAALAAELVSALSAV